jgi:hypothetical protein
MCCIDSHGRSAGAAQTALDFASVAAGAQAGHSELTNKTGIIEPDPLTLTLYPDATHDRDITEDPMVEEFVASLVGSRIGMWPSLERLSSPSAPTQLQDEAQLAAAP